MSNKKLLSVILMVLFIFLLTGCTGKRSNNIDINTPTMISITPTAPPKETERPLQDEMSMEEIYNELYIGEVFKSGYSYIEPFNIDRFPFYESIHFDCYSEKLRFYTIDGSNDVYESVFDLVSSIYIPSQEDSQYYFQSAAGESQQYTLRYKINDEVNDTSIGIAWMNQEISSIDFSDMGKDRKYSELEYNNAVADVSKSIENRNEFEGALSERTIDNSIVGAKQICFIKLEGVSYQILLSKYYFIGLESTADVYVIDVIDEVGNVIKTWEKSNGVAY